MSLYLTLRRRGYPENPLTLPKPKKGVHLSDDTEYEYLLTQAEVAEVFNTTLRTVSNWSSKTNGLFHEEGRGYPYKKIADWANNGKKALVNNYINLDEIDPMEIKASEWAALTPTQRTAMTDYASHLKRVKEVEAKELKLRKDRREVVDAKIVQAEFDRRTAELIQGLSRCGTALSVQLEGRDQREIKRIIDRYINNLRDTYSRTLPKNIKSLDDVENEE